MEFEDKVEQARKLIEQRDQIDDQLLALFGGETVKKGRVCGKCGKPGHNSRNCPEAPKPNGATIS